jgi:hypothetical protein
MDEWREEHADLHPSGVVRAALAERYDERVHEDLPYMFRWLQGRSSQEQEESLIAVGTIRPLGYRCVLERR